MATLYRHLLKQLDLDEPLTGDPKAIRLGGPTLNESPPGRHNVAPLSRNLFRALLVKIHMDEAE